MTRPTTLADEVRAVTADGSIPANPLAAAFARLANESPEQRQARDDRDRAAYEAELKEMAATRDRYRRARYEEARPHEFADVTLDGLLPQQNPDGRGRGWLTSGAKVGLLFGPSGHGKSHLAYAIGNAAIDAGQWVEAWSAAELMRALAPLPTHARRDEIRSTRQERTLDWAKDCDLLILDDLGAEEAGTFAADRWCPTLLEILSARDTNARCRTLVTANAGTTDDQPTDEAKNAVKIAAANSMAARYDTRVATRLRKDSIGIWVEGECLRRPATWNPF